MDTYMYNCRLGNYYLLKLFLLFIHLECIRDMIERGVRGEIKEHLIGGVLLARQCSLEGSHLFPPYKEWFKVRGVV